MNKILLLPGDGIGPEIVTEARKVLEYAGQRFGVPIQIDEGLLGGIAYDTFGTPFPEETQMKAITSKAVLLGAVGGYKWDDLDFDKKPESGLLGIRKALELYANYRPAIILKGMESSSSLKENIVRGTDILVLRELTGGIYFGEPKGIEGEPGSRRGFSTMVYHEDEIVRIAKKAFEAARIRKKKLVSVDKANVLSVSRLWREVVNDVADRYPDIELEHMYVDNAAMQLVRSPTQFDVILTGNMFGDILSDEASMLTGSIGLLPSASIGDKYALYEPIHGSAPDIAGKNLANPIATVLSVAMMFQYSFQQNDAADAIKAAVEKTLEKYRTKDIEEEGKETLSCSDFGDALMETLKNI